VVFAVSGRVGMILLEVFEVFFLFLDFSEQKNDRTLKEEAQEIPGSSMRFIIIVSYPLYLSHSSYNL